MSTQIQPYQKKVENVRSLLDRLKPQIALALPKHMTADRMARVAMTCIMRTPKLLDCDQTSLAGAIVTCSQLGLEPDPLLGHAHLVPFKNRRRGVTEVAVIAGYKGIMKLARNSGEVSTIDAHVVHQKDDFKYAYGLDPVLRHVPFQGADDPGEATHYYAMCRMKDGGKVFLVMTKGEVERHRDRFVRNIDDDSPWRTDFDAMALKTCIRMLSKFMPASVELQRVATLEEHAEAGIPQNLGEVIDVEGVVVPETVSNGNGGAGGGSTLDGLADKMQAERSGGPGDERQAILDAIAKAREDKNIPDAAFNALATEHCGSTLYDHGSVDVAALGALLAAVQRWKGK